MIYILESVKPKWKKAKPDKTSRNIGIISPGQLVSCNNIVNGWMQIEDGWVYSLDSSGKSLFSTNIKHTSKSSAELDSVPYDKRVFYDEEEDDEADEGVVNYQPETSATWMEGNTKVTVKNNGNNTYTQTRVTATAQGDQIDTYVVDSDGNTLETTYVSPQRNGYRNTTTIDSSGKTTKQTYDEDSDSMITTVTDSSGRTISSRSESVNSNLSSVSNDLTRQQAVEVYKQVFTNSAYRFGEHITIDNTFGILGMPYQYMEEVDRVVKGDMGRMFLDRILAKMPLLFIAAGEPKFLAGWSEDDRTKALERIIRGVGGGGILDSYNGNSPNQSRFYLFENQWSIYRQYVQPLVFAAATFLKLGRIELPGGIRITGDWSNFTPLSLHSLTNTMNGCAFYIDSDVSITDNFSNSSGKSQLEQKVNQFSDLAREVQFFLGSLASNAQLDLTKLMPNGNKSDSALNNVENATEFTQNILGKGNFLEAIAGNILTVVQGGKMIFPEIWTDSQYSKSYSVTIKLRCPDGDKLSWFLNIWVPLAHLFPLVLPKAAGANGFLAPFLVRCWYKGLFHCPMGLVTNMTVSRGELGNWNLDGLPMSVNVNLDIKDLYSVLAVSRRSASLGLYSLMENIGMLDFVSNFCGTNIKEGDIERAFRFLAGNFIESAESFPGGVFDGLINAVQNWLLGPSSFFGR